ncbi:hypothetical protein B0H17DRAFT_1129786 [Mycena rosella]|uniref:Uncharacterized protein n=1 Tax=Mycena rosella TaxID=1033263 RepID=A0AAD7DSB1_MYCRO|nr:hypothetical protein B0H17DRAFT_1129786 [Mycena rosella]
MNHGNPSSETGPRSPALYSYGSPGTFICAETLDIVDCPDIFMLLARLPASTTSTLGIRYLDRLDSAVRPLQLRNLATIVGTTSLSALHRVDIRLSWVRKDKVQIQNEFASQPFGHDSGNTFRLFTLPASCMTATFLPPLPTNLDYLVVRVETAGRRMYCRGGPNEERTVTVPTYTSLYVCYSRDYPLERYDKNAAEAEIFSRNEKL